MAGISAGTAWVDVLPNTEKFAKNLQSKMAGIGKVATRGGLLIGGALVLGASKAIGKASALNEAINATEEVFKTSAKAIQTWSKDTTDAFSQVDFLGAAKSFATFARTAGLGDEETAKFSKSLIGAAQDMASFHDMAPTQVLQDIQSGLAGETEPLRKYGILMNEAALQQEGVRLGLIKRGDEMTEQEKVLARQSFIMNNLGAAEGDWNRTRKEGANLQRTMAANTEDLSAKLGKGLLPIWERMVGVGLQITDFFSRNTSLAQTLAIVLGALAAVLLTVGLAIKIVTAALFLMSLTPVVLIIIGIIAALVLLGIGFAVLWKKSETFRKIVTAAFNGIKAVVGVVVNFIRDHWRTLLPILLLPLAPIALVVTKFGTIKTAVLGVWNYVRDKFNTLVGFIGGLPGRISSAASGMWDSIKNSFRNAINTIIGWWNNLSFGVDIPNKIPGLPDSISINTPNVPYLAEGGFLAPGQWGVVGERGPEFIRGGMRGTSVMPVGEQFAGLRIVGVLDVDTGSIDGRIVEVVEGTAAHNTLRRRMVR